MVRIVQDIGRRVAQGIARRFHRDEAGGMLEYAMVFAMVAVPLMVPFIPVDGGERLSVLEMLFQVLSDYFAMIAFYVSWPFL